MYRISFVCIWALVSFSCVAAQEKKPEGEPKVTFEDDVKPIFRQHCQNCHNQNEKKGGLALDSYTALIEGGGSGEVVYDDGDVDGSRLWQLVNHDDTPVMPPKQDKIPAEQLAVLQAWIEAGILEDSDSKAKAKKANPLAFVASSGGKPDGPPAMPESVPMDPQLVTSRKAASTAIATSPWAPLVAIAGQKQIVLYHTETNELLGILPFPEGIAQSIRFSRDGAFIIAGGGEHAVRGMVAVFNVKTGERVATIGDELDVVFDADADPSLSKVAFGGPQRMLRIYDAASSELLFDIKKHTDWIFTVAFSPDGALVASGDRSGGLHVWEAETGRPHLDLPGHKGAIYQVSWRDDSKVLASASEDGTVKIWDIGEGKAVKSINAHSGGVTAVMFDHQGRLLTAGKDNRAVLWDANGKAIRNFEPMAETVLEAAITHDGKHAIYGDWNGDILAVAVADPKKKQALETNPNAIEARTKALQQRLATLQKQIQTLKAESDKANQVVGQASKSVNDLKQKMAKQTQEITAVEKRLGELHKRITQLDAELPKFTAASRERHDEVIANRVQLKKNPERLEIVAASEQTLAELLMKLVTSRRSRVSAQAALAPATKELAQRRAELKQSQSALPQLTARHADGKKAAEAAKNNYDRVHGELIKIQEELGRLHTAAR